jgi:hypothetical protein
MVPLFTVYLHHEIAKAWLELSIVGPGRSRLLRTADHFKSGFLWNYPTNDPTVGPQGGTGTVDTVGVFVYWYGPVRTGTKSIRLLVLLGSKMELSNSRSTEWRGTIRLLGTVPVPVRTGPYQ